MRNILKKTFCTALVLAALVQGIPSDANAARTRAKTPKATGCQQVIPIGRLIWKGCAGSGHLSGDPRGSGAALIAPRGSTTLRPPSCIPILDHAGKRISGLQMYSGNNGLVYTWRAYTNYGCGTGTSMTGLRTKSKNREIYLQVSSKQCIKIDRSFSNINSSQRC